MDFARAWRGGGVRCRNLRGEAGGEDSSGSGSVAEESIDQSSWADAVCRAHGFAACGGRFRRRAKSVALGWPHGNHIDARCFTQHVHDRIEPGHHGIGAGAISCGRWQASLLVFKPARRLQRYGVDLSITTTWTSWQTALTGASRQDLASITLPDCSCTTGECEETCPYGEVWIPDEGVGKFFLLTQFVSGQTQSIYKATSLYQESAGKWTAAPLDPPLRQVLDAANAGAILEAIPDTGCCGWSNESDDQTLLHLRGKSLTMFDELAAYKNPDYDVSFYTLNGKLAPNLGWVALTIVATAKPNTPIQLAEQGQANPEESQHIRKALLDLPAVEVKSVCDSPRRIAFLPQATLVDWISDQEILIVEGHFLVAYNVANGKRRKSNLRVEDVAHVFLR